MGAVALSLRYLTDSSTFGQQGGAPLSAWQGAGYYDQFGRFWGSDKNEAMREAQLMRANEDKPGGLTYNQIRSGHVTNPNTRISPDGQRTSTSSAPSGTPVPVASGSGASRRWIAPHGYVFSSYQIDPYGNYYWAGAGNPPIVPASRRPGGPTRIATNAAIQAIAQEHAAVAAPPAYYGYPPSPPPPPPPMYGFDPGGYGYAPPPPPVVYYPPAAPPPVYGYAVAPPVYYQPAAPPPVYGYAVAPPPAPAAADPMAGLLAALLGTPAPAPAPAPVGLPTDAATQAFLGALLGSSLGGSETTTSSSSYYTDQFGNPVDANGYPVAGGATVDPLNAGVADQRGIFG